MNENKCPWRSQCGTYGHDWCAGFIIGFLTGVAAVAVVGFWQLVNQ